MKKLFGIGAFILFVLIALIPVCQAGITPGIVDWTDYAKKAYDDMGGHLEFVEEGWYGFYKGQLAYLTVEGPEGSLVQYFFWPGHMHMEVVDPSKSGL